MFAKKPNLYVRGNGEEKRGNLKTYGTDPLLGLT